MFGNTDALDFRKQQYAPQFIFFLQWPHSMLLKSKSKKPNAQHIKE